MGSCGAGQVSDPAMTGRADARGEAPRRPQSRLSLASAVAHRAALLTVPEISADTVETPAGNG